MISLSSSFNFDSASLTSSIIICAEQSYLHQIPHQLCYLQNVHHGQKKKIKADDFFDLSDSSNLMIFLLPILNTQEIDYFGQHVSTLYISYP